MLVSVGRGWKIKVARILQAKLGEIEAYRKAAAGDQFTVHGQQQNDLTAPFYIESN